MYRKNQALVNLFEPDVSALGYELWGLELGQSGHGSILRVYIDKDDGITIDDCVLVSQQLTGLLDVEDPIKGQYELEVSSPGMDRPLFKIEHFKKYIGETIKLSLYEKQDNRKRFVGVLTAVNNDEIIINCDNEEVTLPFDVIEKARLVPQF